MRVAPGGPSRTCVGSGRAMFASLGGSWAAIWVSRCDTCPWASYAQLQCSQPQLMVLNTPSPDRAQPLFAA